MHKIKWIDAIDLFSKGGYYDLELEQYIVPKWFALLCKENVVRARHGLAWQGVESNPTKGGSVYDKHEE